MRIVHWFRNDLRIADNRALAAGCARAAQCSPLFVLDDRLLRVYGHCEAKLGFLLDCLRRLADELEARGSRLHLRRGNPLVEVPGFASDVGADLVVWNRDYSSYAKRRDAAVARELGGAGIRARTFKDRVIREGDELLSTAGRPYTVYTPYRRAWWKMLADEDLASPSRLRLPPPAPKVAAGRIPTAADLAIAQEALADSTSGEQKAPRAQPAGFTGGEKVSPRQLADFTGGEKTARSQLADFTGGERASPRQLAGFTGGGKATPRQLAGFTGGEKAAARRLAGFLKNGAGSYAERRDLPAEDGTSRLSPHLRLGTISIRKCFRDAREAAAASPADRAGIERWLDELVWREFYTAILDEFPQVQRSAFRPAFNKIRWENDERLFAAWCEGRTGYPFVDAAMRQLNATGWMHNRARMVVASFLTKDLLIDWRWGERYFIKRLIDGDPAANNGGWQWAASTGTDAQPYFRIFNPSTQGERFDPDGSYIRRWVAELRELAREEIHRPSKELASACGYPPPVVDHSLRRKRALELYRNIE